VCARVVLLNFLIQFFSLMWGLALFSFLKIKRYVTSPCVCTERSPIIKIALARTGRYSPTQERAYVLSMRNTRRTMPQQNRHLRLKNIAVLAMAAAPTTRAPPISDCLDKPSRSLIGGGESGVACGSDALLTSAPGLDDGAFKSNLAIG